MRIVAVASCPGDGGAAAHKRGNVFQDKDRNGFKRGTSIADRDREGLRARVSVLVWGVRVRARV